MRQSLFRQEVIQQQSDRLQGSVLLIPNITHSLWAGVIGIVVIAIALWLFFNTYTNIRSVSGWVSDVQALQTLVVEEGVNGAAMKEGKALGKEISSGLMSSHGEHIHSVELTLLLDIEDVSLVKPDQKIKIQFKDLPTQKFGEFTAAVVTIDNHLSLPGDFSSAPFRPGSPVYKVNARLDNENVNFQGVKIKLRENMQLSATLTSQKQPLYLWLLESLLGNKSGVQQ